MRILMDLVKIRITAAVVLTTAMGYLLATKRVEWDMWLPLLGVLSLACGSAALNQWQESEIDGRMARTRNRPIPSGRLDASFALFIAIVLILIGLLALTSTRKDPVVLLVLGGLALVWYNGVYTYLKRVTAFAVVPGALIGALPPLIGFVAGGGSLRDPTILLVGLFFFVWQIPHFWLLLLMLGDQYREAGLPTVTGTFAHRQLLRISAMWILATATAGLAFPALSRVGLALPWAAGVVVASLWLATEAIALIRLRVGDEDTLPFRRAFRRINVYALLVMLCLSLDAIWI